MFSRPFRVIQFDVVKVEKVGPRGHEYCLTAIDCFSRWCWIVPIPDKTSRSCAKALVERVLLDFALFPTVLRCMRSDNADEFTGESVVAQILREFDIPHVTGSTYHPQSQGMVERLHQSLNKVMRGLVQEHPKDWEQMLPYTQFILRCTPMKALGGRSPYEVVTGIRPAMPASMKASGPVNRLTVDEYCERLLRYLQETYQSIQRIRQNDAELEEGHARGVLSKRIQEEDLVKVIIPPRYAERSGVARFQPRCYPGIFRVKKVLGEHTCEVEDATEPGKALRFNPRIAAERIVRVEVPELELGAEQMRRLEIWEPINNDWLACTIERHALDGRVYLRYDYDPTRVEWTDLSEVRYRWSMAEPEALGANPEAPPDEGLEDLEQLLEPEGGSDDLGPE